MNSLFTAVVVAVLIQFGHIAESALPRFPASLSSKPDYSKYIAENDRIVGGIQARANKFPYQVSLQKKNSNSGSTRHFCGASIISDRYIITAAHCTGGDTKSVQALVGTNTLYDGSGRAYNVSSCKRHPGYNSSTVYADLSLCKTTEAIVFSESVQPIPIAEHNTEVTEPSTFVVTGWGTTSEGGSPTKYLMEVTVPFVNDAKCKEAYGEGEVHEHMLCAGEDGKDSCQGDSGGPLVYFVKGKAVLAGIVSWGYGCARPEFPGVYTEVGSFNPFVLKTCNQDPDNKKPVSSHSFSQ